MMTFGNVFQRKDGRWAVQFKHEGKRQTLYGKTEDEVNRKILATKECINQSDPAISISHDSGKNIVVSSDMTIGEWLVYWLDKYVRPKKSISTYKGYEIYVARHIMPALGNIALNNLTSKILQEFFDIKAINGRLDGKPGGMSPKSMENMYFMLKSAMCQAFEIELINENPISCVKVGKVAKKATAALTHDEESKLIALCSEYENISAFGIIISLRLGLQLGELLSLKWRDIDVSEKQIYVCQSKTDRLISEQDIPDRLFDHIELYRKKQKMIFGIYPDNVIASKNGRAFDPSNYNKLFKHMLNISGIKRANFNILQNTYAVRYLEKGHGLEQLSSVLGCAKTSRALVKHKRNYFSQLSNLLAE